MQHEEERAGRLAAGAAGLRALIEDLVVGVGGNPRAGDRRGVHCLLVWRYAVLHGYALLVELLRLPDRAARLRDLRAQARHVLARVCRHGLLALLQQRDVRCIGRPGRFEANVLHGESAVLGLLLGEARVLDDHARALAHDLRPREQGARGDGPARPAARLGPARLLRLRGPAGACGARRRQAQEQEAGCTERGPHARRGGGR
mmetsp:Transcript_44926/g.124948  ORF Transcript_44926/g.124948 Transcript_44926/m.124948 type:complete len:203 (+) Transcript_44926:309-917(+)